MFMFSTWWMDFEKMVYICARYLVKNEIKMLFDLSRIKEYETIQEIKWFESRPKNQEKLTIWFESWFLWFRSYDSSHESLRFVSHSQNKKSKNC